MNFKNIFSILPLILISSLLFIAPLFAQSATGHVMPAEQGPPPVLTEEENAALTAFYGKNLIIFYSVTGNTQDLANIIQSFTKGDLYRIDTVETYPTGEDLIPYAKKERDELRVPTLKGDPPNLADYEYIFFGTPVWFHDIPPATLLFLGQTDFKGKKIIPFVTAGGGPGDSIATITANVRNGQVLNPKLLTRYTSLAKDEIQKDVAFWLSTIMNSASTGH